MSTDIVVLKLGCSERINELKEELLLLASQLRASWSQVRVDALWSIPLRADWRVNPDHPIEVIEVPVEEQMEIAIEALTSMWLRPDQRPKQTLRVPGAIAVPNHILAQVTKTNGIRNELLCLIEKLTPEHRKLVWKAAGYPISSLQTLRATAVLTQPAAIQFKWYVGKAIKKWVVSDLIAVLIKQSSESQENYTSDGHGDLPENSVELKHKYWLESLRNLDSHEVVAQQRIIAPSLLARIKTCGQAEFNSPASVPLIYSTDGPIPSIRRLERYDPALAAKSSGANSGSTRSRLEIHPVAGLETLNVYQYQVQYRKDQVIKKSKPKSESKRANSEFR